MSAPTRRSSTHGGEFLKRQESICAKRAEIAGVILGKADEADGLICPREAGQRSRADQRDG